MVGFESVMAARERIGSFVVETPCVPSTALSQRSGCSLWLKLESFQHTGSFKARGALNRIVQLSSQERRRGVLAFSAGNHAQGVAWAARQVGVEGRIVMPRPTPLVKITRTRALGAAVERFGETFAEAEMRAAEIREREQLVFIHPFDDPEIIAGQGTAGLEILEQVPDVEAIVCPIGGGGLIAGVAIAVKALKPEVRIFGVQSESAPSMYESVAGGKLARSATKPTLAEGIAVKSPSDMTYEVVRRYVDEIALVSEGDVEAAVYELLSEGGILSEGAAAAAYAALMAGNLGQLRGRRVVVLHSGANIDLNLLARIIERAQVRTGRLARLAITVGDRPGALAGVLRVVGEAEVNIMDVLHERSFSQHDVWQVEIELVLETRDREHLDEVIAALLEAGYGSIAELGPRALPFPE